MIEHFLYGETSRTKTTLVVGIFGVTLNFFKYAILDV